jgi:hypothetical protein
MSQPSCQFVWSNSFPFAFGFSFLNFLKPSSRLGTLFLSWFLKTKPIINSSSIPCESLSSFLSFSFSRKKLLWSIGPCMHSEFVTPCFESSFWAKFDQVRNLSVFLAVEEVVSSIGVESSVTHSIVLRCDHQAFSQKPLNAQMSSDPMYMSGFSLNMISSILSCPYPALLFVALFVSHSFSIFLSYPWKKF